MHQNKDKIRDIQSWHLSLILLYCCWIIKRMFEVTTIGHETEELEFKKRLESLLNLVLFVLCSFFVLFWRAMRSSLAVGGHPTNATPLRSVCLYSFNVFCLSKTNKLPPGNFLPNSRSSIGCFPPKKDKAFCFVLFWRAMRSSNPQPLVP